MRIREIRSYTTLLQLWSLLHRHCNLCLILCTILAMRLPGRPNIMPKTSPGGQRISVRSHLTIAVVSGLLLAASTLAWGAPPQPASRKVAATIFPLYDLVRQVAGPAVEVILLVPPGTSEHTFTVRPGRSAPSRVARLFLPLATGWTIGSHGWHGKPVCRALSFWIQEYLYAVGIASITAMAMLVPVRRLRMPLIRITGSPFRMLYVWCRILPTRLHSSIRRRGQTISSVLLRTWSNCTVPI